MRCLNCTFVVDYVCKNMLTGESSKYLNTVGSSLKKL